MKHGNATDDAKMPVAAAGASFPSIIAARPALLTAGDL
jgi:hypothetical protein